MTWTLSQRAQKLTSSAIREILKVTERPDVISFAGGLPSPATFPVTQLQQACNEILTTEPTPALQYGPTEGYMPLREWIAVHHSKRCGIPIGADQVLVTTGSQQGLDLLAKVLIDTGSKVLVETPTYLGALQAFSLAEPRYCSVPSDDAGLIPASLTAEMCQEARFLYCLPNFQNPSGRRLPLERRQQLAEITARAGLLLIEDDPYGDLYYQGEPLPGLLSMNPGGVVYLGSFSKVLAPGLRVGYLIAPPALQRKLVQAKQAADLHTPSFTQRMVHTTIKDGFLDSHLRQVAVEEAVLREACSSGCNCRPTSIVANCLKPPFSSTSHSFLGRPSMPTNRSPIPCDCPSSRYHRPRSRPALRAWVPCLPCGRSRDSRETGAGTDTEPKHAGQAVAAGYLPVLFASPCSLNIYSA